MKFRILIGVLCLLLCGCTEQVLVIVRNQIDHPIQLLIPAQRSVSTGEEISTKLPIDQMIVIDDGGRKFRYHVTLPNAHKDFVTRDGLTVTFKLTLLPDERLCATPVDGPIDLKSQPNGFPLEPQRL
jgi:hypothetical protein